MPIEKGSLQSRLFSCATRGSANISEVTSAHFYIVLAIAWLIFPAALFGQLQPSPPATWAEAVSAAQPPEAYRLTEFDKLTEGLPTADARNNGYLDSPKKAGDVGKQNFHWSRALTESFTFLLIEQAYVIHTDFRWVVSQNGIPFNHYWRDYKQSLSDWTTSGWNDGDPNWFGYIGHPIQGALTGFIQIQNDPKGQRLEFSRTKAYWKSRLKAALWNTVYSTQWNLGPLSEATVEKYGAKDRSPWNQNGSWPCTTKNCYTGVGQIDIVMTPLGGIGWLIGEDFLDKKVVRHVEERSDNRLLIDAVRVALNPIRGGANVLHGKPLWYRASRDDEGTILFDEQKIAAPKSESSITQTPNHGNIWFGYTHTGASHCEVVINAKPTTCDPLSSASSKLSGWNIGLEKMYLRYFGAIADFSGQYGSVSQRNFLFGLRGGASIGRFRPFAQAMIGAVQVHQSTPAGPVSETSFAEDLGLGLDFRLIRRLSWRNQADALKTGTPDFQRYNVRLSSGFAVRF
jgi:hypothetical protein